ncbi:hypothetical protein HYV86_05910 [Candidatus Woesearchaeota archaeon]|nr:hypothetical protein [Candidatus Woesearchaeota archaeon]
MAFMDYFDRSARMAHILRQDAQLLDRARMCFQAVYNARAELSSYSPIIVPPPLLELGSGKDHIVIALRPEKEEPIPVALRLGLKQPYHLTTRIGRNLFAQQLDAYHKAFEYGDDPSSFIVPVTTSVRWQGMEYHAVGILMEDLSNGKRNILQEEPDVEVAQVIYPDGKRRRRFIDPTSHFESDMGIRYLEDHLRIDL